MSAPRVEPSSLAALGSSILIALSGCAGSTEDAASRLIAEATKDHGAYEKLAFLSDRIGPRLSGSAGLERAVAWTAEEMRRDGMDKVWTEKVLVPHWVRGVETGRILSPVEHPMALTALGGSEPTPPGGIGAEVVEVTSFDDLKAAGGRVAGRIVFFNHAMRRNGAGREGYGFASRMRTRGAIEAAKLGAVATIIRSLGTAAYRLPHTGAMSYDPNVPRIPAAAIAVEDADLIHRLLAAGDTVRVEIVLGCRTLEDVESANVLADLRGSDKPDEIVLIGGHLDSWDLGTGAIDDGAGVAIVMQSMKVLRAFEPRPRRTIRAVLFTNEENGLRGGKAYAKEHQAEIALHTAAIESDGGGATPEGFGVSAGPAGTDVVHQIAASLYAIGSGSVRTGGGGADISPLGNAGVPLLGLRQEGTYYFDWHHTAADTLDKVSPRDLALNVAALSVMAYGLADLEEPLPRQKPRSEEREDGLAPASPAVEGAPHPGKAEPPHPGPGGR
jgi:hypothetical protein